MCASVIISAVGGPPHSWGALQREDSLGLNPLLTHCMVHQSCNNWMGVIDGDLFIFLILVFPGCPVRAVGSVWKSFCAMKISYVVYPIDDDVHLSACGKMCFCVDICDMTWSNFSVNYFGCDFCVCDCRNVILTC